MLNGWSAMGILLLVFRRYMHFICIVAHAPELGKDQDF